MGCSCKKMNNIQKSLKDYEGKSGNKLTNSIFEFCLSLINRVIICILFVIIVPIVLLILLINFIINGKFSFPITRLNKVGVKDLKNELEKIL